MTFDPTPIDFSKGLTLFQDINLVNVKFRSENTGRITTLETAALAGQYRQAAESSVVYRDRPLAL